MQKAIRSALGRRRETASGKAGRVNLREGLGWKPLTLLLPPELTVELAAQRAREGRDKSMIVADALRAYLDAYRAKETHK